MLVVFWFHFEADKWDTLRYLVWTNSHQDCSWHLDEVELDLDFAPQWKQERIAREDNFLLIFLIIPPSVLSRESDTPVWRLEGGYF